MVAREIMKTEAVTCTLDDDVATVARTMRERRCGFVPVVDTNGSVIGVVTDRDLCLAAAVERHRAVERIAVRQAMSHPAFSCLPDDDLKAVLATMAKHHVRRLTVVDAQGHLQGVLSIDDIVQLPARSGRPSAEEIVDALKSILAPRPIEAATM